jgi:hypothetical protein
MRREAASIYAGGASAPERGASAPERSEAIGLSVWSAMHDIPGPDDLPDDITPEHIPIQRAPEETKDGGLDKRELQILAFEGRWWKHAGSKEQAVRDTFGVSSTRYYHLLNGLLDNPAALEHDPVLVGRLRRLRSTRARTRRR